VELVESRPEENPTEKLKRHYILDGNDKEKNYKMHLLDYESALFMVAVKPAIMREVGAYGLTFVVIEECSNELLGFSDDAK
jgi:hypothetical protein